VCVCVLGAACRMKLNLINQSKKTIQQQQGETFVDNLKRTRPVRPSGLFECHLESMESYIDRSIQIQ
jgi:hypothetical protein